VWLGLLVLESIRFFYLRRRRGHEVKTLRYTLRQFLDLTRGGLIVSCQSREGEPAHGMLDMLGMAVAVHAGGAKALRLEGSSDIKRASKLVNLPIIGLVKKEIPGCEVYITPTIELALEVEKAGADIAAVDASASPRPGFKSGAEFIKELKKQLRIPVLADVSTFEEGLMAADSGADIVATTLSGYTRKTRPRKTPDFALLKRLASSIVKPVILEGHVQRGAQAARAIAFGAHAVVVGGAITRPHLIAKNFADALEIAAREAFGR
jgi:N-acylglucosamine-6-phosphate 2-epimerase